MIERNAAIIRQIESALIEETKLQLSYTAAIEEEKTHITKFKPRELPALTDKRAALYVQIEAAKKRREELTRKLSGGTNQTLTSVLKTQAHPDDAARLIGHAEKLRTLVMANVARGREFGRLAHFALTLLSGTISILWSATHSITRGYGRNGALKESLTPKTRKQTTLEEA